MTDKTLKKTFIIYIAAAIFSICIFLTFFYSYTNYKSKLKISKKNIQNIITNNLPVYENYLWILDFKNIKNFSNSLLTGHNFLCGLSVTNEKNKPIYKKYIENNNCQKEKITIQKRLFHNNQYIGNIKFIFSTYHIKKEFYNLIVMGILLSLILALLVFYIIILIFRYFIENPISLIISHLDELSEGKYETYINKTGLEEFDKLIESINIMQNNIKKRKIQNIELTEKLNNLINNLPDGFLILDKNGNYIDINEGLGRMLKMSKQEIFSKKIEEYSTIYYNTKRGFEVLEEIIRKGYLEFEWEIIDKEGNKKPTLAKGKKIKLGKDEVIIFSIIDISYMKKLQKELLTKEKLSSLGILAGGIAHDFNNILTSINGYIELIKLFIERGDYAKASEKLTKLSQPVKNAKSLTHQLLTFSKGGVPIKKTVFNLKDLITDTVLFILSGTAIKADFEIDTNLNPVKIDPEQFSQVIQNIVLNAKEALNNKGLLQIRAVNSLEFVKISIKDFGGGIPEEILDKIWDPYFTTKDSGSGLGLAIAYSIIKKHDGDIKVYSIQGKSTEFQIFIPAINITTETEEDDEETLNITTEKTKENLKILIMDDNIDIQQILYDLLTALNHQVEIASTGEEAIEKYKEGKFDIVFLDLTVKGGMGGKECIEKLKEIDRNVTAIVSSGYSNDPVMTEYKKYGFKGVLQKPYKIEELKEIINSAL